jgi:hypothetical protein
MEKSTIFSNASTKDWPKKAKCNCQSSLHPLVCNCLNCGRIVCEEDFTSAACNWCGFPLQAAQKIGSEKAAKLLKKASLANALNKRDQLCKADLDVGKMQIHDQNVDVDFSSESEEELFLELRFDQTGRVVKELSNQKKDCRKVELVSDSI